MDTDIILRAIHNKWAHHSEQVKKEREEHAREMRWNQLIKKMKEIK